MSRRKFVCNALSGVAAFAVLPNITLGAAPVRPNASLQEKWRLEMDGILGRIKAPVFPQRDFDIRRYGAVADGSADSLPAVMKAINECNAAGGGRVNVPLGKWWLRGPVHLKSNVNLHIAEGAEVRFDPAAELYLPPVLTRWEGTELFNYSPMVYAYQATNVAITGKGIIDGNAKDTFARWKPDQKKAQSLLRKMGADGVPVHQRVFGEGHWLRPGMIQFFGCRNVLLEGVTILDAPFWVVHPVYCQNVTVRGIRIDSHNANNDGVDPDSCVDVLIEDCHFNTGDDSVAIKSGRDQDGWRVGQATENVIVRNCDMNSRHNGLCVGSEMSAGVRNIFLDHCRIGKVDAAIFFKANLDRGGIVENVHVSNVSVADAETLIHFTTAYHSYRGGSYPPTFRNFTISDVTCARASMAIDAVGVAGTPLINIRLKNIVVTHASEAKNVRHVENLVLENVRVNGAVVQLQ